MNDNNSLRWQTILYYLWSRLLDGLRSVRHSRAKQGLSLAYLVLSVCLLVCNAYPATGPLAHFLQPIGVVLTSAAVIIVYAAAVTVSVIPPGVRAMSEAFIRIGLVNNAHEPPLLARLSRRGDRSEAEYFIRGIPLKKWQNAKDSIESAANVRIVFIKQGRDKQHIILLLAPGNAQLPTRVHLPHNVSLSSSQFLLGESLDGAVIGDLEVVPHFLIGGATSSGKSTEGKSIIFQFIIKRDEYGPVADVAIIDFKGGQDYPPAWRNRDCDFASTPEDALSILSRHTEELHRRQALFTQMADWRGRPCSCLKDYNDLVPPGRRLRRKIIVIDELAELTDTTGMDKPHKELANTIIAHLATIARMGRSVGINLILLTQRPEANVCPGQIKNNVAGRLCGITPDPELFRMILGDTAAADHVPPDVPGRFVMQDGTELQGYLLDDDEDNASDDNDDGKKGVK